MNRHDKVAARLLTSPLLCAITLCAALTGCVLDDSTSSAGAGDSPAPSAPSAPASAADPTPPAPSTPASAADPTPVAQAHGLSRVAGYTGTCGTLDGVGISARFSKPSYIATDAAGNAYIVDRLSSAIRKMAPDGSVSTLVGGGSNGDTPLDGPLASARIVNPTGIAVSRDGQAVFVLQDVSQSRSVRKIAGGIVSTILLTSDVGAVRSATLVGDDLYFIAGRDIVKIPNVSSAPDSTGAGSVDVVHVAGTDTNHPLFPTVSLAGPNVLKSDSKGNLLYLQDGDFDLHEIFSDGTQATILSSIGQHSTFALDSQDSVFLVSIENYSISKIAPNGVPTRISGQEGSAGEFDGDKSVARIGYGVFDVAFSPTRGSLLFTNYDACTVRSVDVASGSISTLAGVAYANFDKVADASLGRDDFTDVNGLSLALDSSGVLWTGNGHSVSRIDEGSASVTNFGFAPHIKDVHDLAFDSTGVLYGISGTEVFKADPSAADKFSSITGQAGAGYTDGPLSSAQFSALSGLVFDSDGSIFVTDRGNKVMRKIAGDSVTTLAGHSNSSVPSNGIGAQAAFANPRGVAIDGNTLYVSQDHAVASIDKRTGEVAILAGGVTPGSADGIGAAASFNSPNGLMLDGHGNLFVADTGNGLIRKVVLATGEVSTYLGQRGKIGITLGSSDKATLAAPQSLKLGANGVLYISDSRAVLKFTP